MRVGDKFRVGKNILNNIYFISDIRKNDVDVSWYQDGDLKFTTYERKEVDDYFNKGSWNLVRNIRHERLDKLKKINESRK